MLNGEKIKLVTLEKEDLEKSRSWANNMNLQKKILRVLPVTQSDEELWYQEILRNSSKIVFAIKTFNDEHIGNTGFYYIDWIHRRAEFWILIGEENFLRRGIGSEVLSLMLIYGFHHLNLNRIYLYVGSDNIEAVDLYKKLGFVKEGILKSHYYIENKYIDVIIMSILRENYGYKK